MRSHGPPVHGARRTARPSPPHAQRDEASAAKPRLTKSLAHHCAARYASRPHSPHPRISASCSPCQRLLAVDRRTWLKTATIAGASAAGLAAASDLHALTPTRPRRNARRPPPRRDRPPSPPPTAPSSPPRPARSAASRATACSSSRGSRTPTPPPARTASSRRSRSSRGPTCAPRIAWGPVSPHGPRTGWVNQEEQFLYQWDDGFEGEDMLRVNVWTPSVSDGRKRPVLVWLHGGGYASGLRPRASPVRRRAPRARARRRPRLGEPPPQRARLPRPVADRRREVRVVRQRRDARSRERPPLGARERRAVRGRSGERHHLRAVGWRRKGDHAHGDARREGAVPQGRRDQRLTLLLRHPRRRDEARQRRAHRARDRKGPARQAPLPSGEPARRRGVRRAGEGVSVRVPEARRHVARAGLAAARRRQGPADATVRSRRRPPSRRTCPSSSGTPSTSSRPGPTTRRRI